MMYAILSEPQLLTQAEEAAAPPEQKQLVTHEMASANWAQRGYYSWVHERMRRAGWRSVYEH